LILVKQAKNRANEIKVLPSASAAMSHFRESRSIQFFEAEEAALSLEWQFLPAEVLFLF